ncbi:MAG TPA: hypothetical protein VN222_18390, partial [Novosphingobium sp.]|nr:hypothetical protein [Novosphingobium sp.]
MQTMIEMNWPIFAAVLALGLLVAWLVWRSKRAGERRQRHHGADVLDEGAAPARRNQALIDAPSAAAQASLAAGLADTGPAVTMSGIGEVIAVAAAREAIAAMPAEQAPAPAEEAPAQAAPAAQADQDDLTRIKGL